MAIAPTVLGRRGPDLDVDASLSDEDLVGRLRDGDEGAFRVLVARHRPWLVRLGTRLLGNDAHGAEDLAQETLLKLHAAVRRDHRPMRVRPWLAVVARHASADEHRKRRPDLPGELPEAPAVGDGLFELDPALRRAWSTLGGRHREVVYLRELMDLSYREIAVVMGLSNSAVETLLFRARAALRREYERAGGSRFGCGVLGLGLYRFATDGAGRPAGAAAHVPGCHACSRAVDTLGSAGSVTVAPAADPGAAPTGRGPGAGQLPVAGADLSGLPAPAWTASSPVWSALAGSEPILTKVLSAGVAIAAAVIPVVVTASAPAPSTPPSAAVAAAGTPGESVDARRPWPWESLAGPERDPGYVSADRDGAASPAPPPAPEPAPVDAELRPAGTPEGPVNGGEQPPAMDEVPGTGRLGEGSQVGAREFRPVRRAGQALNLTADDRAGVGDGLRPSVRPAPPARRLDPQPVAPRSEHRPSAVLSGLLPRPSDLAALAPDPATSPAGAGEEPGGVGESEPADGHGPGGDAAGDDESDRPAFPALLSSTPRK